MTENLIYIPVAELLPHPDNPRKDVGDVSELAASIKESGVLQNLTVVPGHYRTKEEWTAICRAEGVSKASADSSYEPDFLDGGYTVIIGHRRLAACKLAGIDKVPCIVADMDQQEQFRTMMVENMQRSDLTVLEEADGFQLMMDMGDSVADIAQQTGLSDTTIRRRLSIGKLDRKKVLKGYERGATLGDYLQLEKIEDPDARDEVLKYIGTSDFNQKLKEAVKKQNDRKWLEEITEQFRAADWCTEVKESDYSKMQYVKNYGIWNRKLGTVIKPGDADSVKYFFRVCSQEVDLYREKTEAEPRTTEEERIRARYTERMKELQDELECISDECRDLRTDYVMDFDRFKTDAENVQRFAASAVLYVLQHQNVYGRFNDCLADVADALGVECDTDGYVPEINSEEMEKAIEQHPDKALLYMGFFQMEACPLRAYRTEWDSKCRLYVPVYEKNERLEETYRMLQGIGYRISTEEMDYMLGHMHQYYEAQKLVEEMKEELGADQ